MKFQETLKKIFASIKSDYWNNNKKKNNKIIKSLFKLMQHLRGAKTAKSTYSPILYTGGTILIYSILEVQNVFTLYWR